MCWCSPQAYTEALSAEEWHPQNQQTPSLQGFRSHWDLWESSCWSSLDRVQPWRPWESLSWRPQDPMSPSFSHRFLDPANAGSHLPYQGRPPSALMPSPQDEPHLLWERDHRPVEPTPWQSLECRYEAEPLRQSALLSLCRVCWRQKQASRSLLVSSLSLCDPRLHDDRRSRNSRISESEIFWGNLLSGRNGQSRDLSWMPTLRLW